MTSVNFQQWIQHPETLNRDTLYELRNLLARYPYFQSLRLLYRICIFSMILVSVENCGKQFFTLQTDGSCSG